MADTEYKIGEFSIITRLSVKTLRFYQAEGLLEPLRVDPINGYRIYSAKSLERAELIRELRSFGFTLHDIRQIVSTCAEDEDFLPFVERKRTEIIEQLHKYRSIESRLDKIIQAAKERMNMAQTLDTSGVDSIEVAELLVVSIRYKGQYSDVGKHIGSLYRAAGSKAAGGPFSLYHDGEYKENDADIELCVPIKGPVSISQKDSAQGIQERTLPSSRFIRAIHKGSYESIGETYRLLYDYLLAHSLKPKTPSREIYHKGPGMFFRGNPKNYITELQMPLE